jgi:hypothetical protein
MVVLRGGRELRAYLFRVSSYVCVRSRTSSSVPFDRCIVLQSVVEEVLLS